jgi:hypothetical protein
VVDFVRGKDGDTALVVTYLAIEQHFSSLSGVETGHFNAIAGLDRFNDVNSVFVIGRPLPDPRELRLLTIALTGRPIPETQAQQETRGALMADGTGAAISVRAYADPDLEAVRTAISDAEVIQAIGRGRAINRTAETPLDVWVMADVCLPLPVNELVKWADVRLNPIQQMAARGAVIFSPADAVKACPDLFSTEEAAKKAIQRAMPEGDLRDISLSNISLRGLSLKSPVRVAYRPVGRGRPWNRIALVAGWRVGGFREWLEGLVGPLAFYEVTEPPPPPPHPSAPAPTPPPFAPADGDLPVTASDDPGWTAEAWHHAGHSDPEPVWWHQDATRDVQPVWPESG